jgi:DNA-binding PadR family transcriptional regulator
MSTPGLTKKQLLRRELKSEIEEYSLKLCISKGSLHGYGLIDQIKKSFGVLFSPSEIYPVLWNLEKNGYLASKREFTDSGRARRAYYPVPVKTVRRLKEIVAIKNQNRKKLNDVSSGIFGVQLAESPVVET